MIAAMNPCPCGYYGDPGRECSCSMGMVSKYQKRLSGPERGFIRASRALRERRATEREARRQRAFPKSFLLGDVAFMLIAIILVPYLYLALPPWLLAGLLGLGALSMLYSGAGAARALAHLVGGGHFVGH